MLFRSLGEQVAHDRAAGIPAAIEIDRGNQRLERIGENRIAPKATALEFARSQVQLIADLEFSRKRIAKDVRKCLESAIANAENNHELDIDDLVVAEAHVGKALVLKRFSPRGRGRMGRIMKPFSHLTIVVREVEEAASAKA